MKNEEKLKIFKQLINEMNIEDLKTMTEGMQLFTKMCIDNKFKQQRNAVIDFALTAILICNERILLKSEEENIPY